MNTDNSAELLHYEISGNGDPVILLHGLLMDGESWVKNGFVAALEGKFSVVRIDLPGHGGSVAINQQQSFSLPQQMAAVIAVMDKLGYEKAHVVGYSAGSWLANGLIKNYPHRLSSVVLGGWDTERGLPPGPHGPLTFELFMGFARMTAPHLSAWVTPEHEAGIDFFFSQLLQPQHPFRATVERDVPILMWAGQDDLIYQGVKSTVSEYNLLFISSAGDHLAAIESVEANTVQQIKSFLLVHQ